MSWETSTRRERLPDNWEWLRKQVFEACGYRCESVNEETGRRCILPATEVDHIKPDYLGGTNDLDNLAGICTPHHRAKSAREGAAAQKAQREKRFRPKPVHPGLIPPGGEDDSRADSTRQRENQPQPTSFWGAAAQRNEAGEDPGVP